MMGALDKAMRRSPVAMEWQAAQDMLPLAPALGLSVEMPGILRYLGATMSSLRASQKGIAAAVPGVVIHVGGELDAVSGEWVVNPGRMARSLEMLRRVRPDLTIFEAKIEKMPFESGVASLVKGNRLPAGSIDWEAAAVEIDRVLVSGGKVDISAMGSLAPLKEALLKLGWQSVDLRFEARLTATKP